MNEDSTIFYEKIYKKRGGAFLLLNVDRKQRFDEYSEHLTIV